MCLGKSQKDMERIVTVTSENVVTPHTVDKKGDMEVLSRLIYNLTNSLA
jgi:hypothetical protein